MSHQAFKISDDHAMIYATAEKYAREKLAPLAEEMDESESFPSHLYRELGAQGYLGVTAPAELGGAGMDELAQGLVCEAFSKYNPAVAMSVGVHDNVCLNNLVRNASEEQKQRLIPKMCAGESVGALGLTEPGAGSDAIGGMRTVARREGEHYVLNGTKLYITNGPIADVVLLYAKTQPERGARGVSAFLIETDSPGFSVAQKLNKMGMRGSETGELVLDECRVPVSNLVGEENAGVSILMSGLDIERSFAAFQCVGMAARGLELALEHARIREQFGKPIGSVQLVQGMLAEMYTKLEASRLLTYSTMIDCSAVDNSQVGRGEIHKRTAAAMMFAADACSEILDHALQIHGGMGYMFEAEINRLYRAGRFMQIGGGTTEIRKTIIANELLAP